MHNNSYSNLKRALFERVLSVNIGGVQQTPPQPQPGFVDREMKSFTRRLLHAVRRVPPMSTEQFVDSYVGKKRTMYENVAKNLDIQPITRKDSYIQAFIKDEKTNLTRKNDPCPRVIQPRSARFNVAIGIHLKPMEKPIFRGIGAVFGSSTVMKGLNAQQRGVEVKRKWDKFDEPYAIMMDASRFDQHCNKDIISWEHMVEEKIAIRRDELKRLNKFRRPNHCYFRTDDGDCGYILNGVRMSGDMDTALCNCLTMCAMTYSFMAWIGVLAYEYMNDGDDGVLIVEKRDSDIILRLFQDYFRRFGFTMKLEGVSDTIEGIEFCQARPVFDGTSYRFVRDPTICLGKDSLSLKTSVDVDEMQHLRNSVGWCGLSLAGDMPIFNEYYRSMISTPEVALTEYTTGMHYMSKGMKTKYSQPSDETRISFYNAYGIAPDTQLAIEAIIREYPSHITRPAELVTSFTNYTHTL